MNKLYSLFFKESLDSIKEQNQLRSIEDKILPKGCIDFGSSDYLGLASQEVNKIFSNLSQANPADQHLRLGSSGSRLTTGTHQIHLELEKKIAQWQNTESALVFSTGYAANLGTLSCILNSRDVVYMDELAHASLRDGVRLSKAKKYYYKHNNIDHLEELLKATRNKSHKSLIITESIFSMDGDKAELFKIQELAEKYQSSIYLDEAHATGVLGKNGAGLIEELNNLSPQINLNSGNTMIKMGSLSKAIGVEGAFIAGSKELIDFLVNHARTFIYSISLSPLISQLILNNIELSIQETKLRSKLNSNIEFFKAQLQKLEQSSNGRLSWSNENTPIFAIYVGDTKDTLETINKLKNNGIRVPAIRPPTVDRARLRVCINTQHSQEEIEKLSSALQIN